MLRSLAFPNLEMLWECGIGLPSPPTPLPSLGEGSRSRRIWRGEGCLGEGKPQKLSSVDFALIPNPSPKLGRGEPEPQDLAG
jgi:hypothetical protein